MTLRPCLVCGTPTERSRCPNHQPSADHHRPNKPSATARGYDWTWTQLSKRARRAQPWCTDCGATNDLQTDHKPEAWDRRAAGLPIRLADVDVVCGPCNRARGTARPGGMPQGVHPDPLGPSQSSGYTPPGGIG